MLRGDGDSDNYVDGMDLDENIKSLSNDVCIDRFVVYMHKYQDKTIMKQLQQVLIHFHQFLPIALNLTLCNVEKHR